MSNIEQRQTQLAKIKKKLFDAGTIEMFRGYLPIANKEQAKAAAERFIKMLYTTIMLSPALQECDDKSLLQAASISASLNLDLGPQGLAYLVPFKKQAVFIIGYQGLMELAYRSGKVRSFSATVIRESEKDKLVVTRENGKISIIHPFSWEPPTGEIIGCYTSVEIEGMGVQQFLLRRDEIEFFRSKSACPNSPAWKDHYEAMCKKTTVRQHCKWLPKSITKDMDAAIAKEEEQNVKYVDASIIKAKELEAEAGSIQIETDVFAGESQAADENNNPSFLDD